MLPDLLTSPIDEVMEYLSGGQPAQYSTLVEERLCGLRITQLKRQLQSTIVGAICLAEDLNSILRDVDLGTSSASERKRYRKQAEKVETLLKKSSAQLTAFEFPWKLYSEGLDIDDLVD